MPGITRFNRGAKQNIPAKPAEASPAARVATNNENVNDEQQQQMDEHHDFTGFPEDTPGKNDNNNEVYGFFGGGNFDDSISYDDYDVGEDYMMEGGEDTEYNNAEQMGEGDAVPDDLSSDKQLNTTNDSANTQSATGNANSNSTGGGVLNMFKNRKQKKQESEADPSTTEPAVYDSSPIPESDPILTLAKNFGINQEESIGGNIQEEDVPTTSQELMPPPNPVTETVNKQQEPTYSSMVTCGSDPSGSHKTSNLKEREVEIHSITCESSNQSENNATDVTSTVAFPTLAKGFTVNTSPEQNTVYEPARSHTDNSQSDDIAHNERVQVQQQSTTSYSNQQGVMSRSPIATHEPDETNNRSTHDHDSMTDADDNAHDQREQVHSPSISNHNVQAVMSRRNEPDQLNNNSTHTHDSITDADDNVRGQREQVQQSTASHSNQQGVVSCRQKTMYGPDQLNNSRTHTHDPMSDVDDSAHDQRGQVQQQCITSNLNQQGAMPHRPMAMLGPDHFKNSNANNTHDSMNGVDDNVRRQREQVQQSTASHSNQQGVVSRRPIAMHETARLNNNNANSTHDSISDVDYNIGEQRGQVNSSSTLYQKQQVVMSRRPMMNSNQQQQKQHQKRQQGNTMIATKTINKLPAISEMASPKPTSSVDYDDFSTATKEPSMSQLSTVSPSPVPTRKLMKKTNKSHHHHNNNENIYSGTYTLTTYNSPTVPAHTARNNTATRTLPTDDSFEGLLERFSKDVRDSTDSMNAFDINILELQIELATQHQKALSCQKDMFSLLESIQQAEMFILSEIDDRDT